MASHWYSGGIMRGLDNTVDFDGASVKIGLSAAAHIPDIDDDFLDIAGTADFTANEATGTGYVGTFGGAGRKNLVSNDVTTVDASNRAMFDAADLTWTAYNPTNAAAQATILVEITNDTLSPCLVNLDFPDVDPNGNDFTIQFHADGIGYITSS